MRVILIKMVCLTFFLFDFLFFWFFLLGDLLISSSDDDTIVVYDCEAGL